MALLIDKYFSELEGVVESVIYSFIQDLSNNNRLLLFTRRFIVEFMSVISESFLRLRLIL